MQWGWLIFVLLNKDRPMTKAEAGAATSVCVCVSHMQDSVHFHVHFIFDSMPVIFYVKWTWQSVSSTYNGNVNYYVDFTLGSLGVLYSVK